MAREEGEVGRPLTFSCLLLIACGIMQPRMGMTFNELYGQAAREGCGWLEAVSATGRIIVYHVTQSNPDCNPNIYFFFQDDQLVDIKRGLLYEQ